MNRSGTRPPSTCSGVTTTRTTSTTTTAWSPPHSASPSPPMINSLPAYGDWHPSRRIVSSTSWTLHPQRPALRNRGTNSRLCRPHPHGRQGHGTSSSSQTPILPYATWLTRCYISDYRISHERKTMKEMKKNWKSLPMNPNIRHHQYITIAHIFSRKHRTKS